MQSETVAARRPTRPTQRTVITEAFRTFRGFCGLLQVRDKTGRRVPFRLNRSQKKWIAARTQRDVCLKGRQVGLTTVVIALMVYRFLTVPGASVVIVCQAMAEDNNVREISSTIEVYLQSLEALGVALSFRSRTATLWELSGRDSKLAIITAGASETASDKKGRSQRITHLHCTEVAYWEYADVTLRALFNCVPGRETGSEIVIECTAKGAAGAFYDTCDQARDGRNGYAFHFLPWYSHEEYETALEPGERVEPRTPHQHALVEQHGISPEQLKWWQGKVASPEAGGDEEFVKQEYPSDPDSCFLVSGNCFFDLQEVTAMLEACAPPLEVRDRGRVRIFHRPEPNQQYVVSADTAEGTGGNESGGMVWERGTGRHMATLRGQYIPWDLAEALAKLGYEYNVATVAPERNNHGHAVLQALTRLTDAHGRPRPYPRVYVHWDKKRGWLTSPQSRPMMLDEFDASVRSRDFDTDDRDLCRQMRTFVTGPNGKAEAARGKNDDLVLTAAIGWAVIHRPTTRYGTASADPV